MMMEALGLALHGDKPETAKGDEAPQVPAPEPGFEDPVSRSTVGRSFSDILKDADERRTAEAASPAAATPAAAAPATPEATPAAETPAALADKPIEVEKRKPITEIVEGAMRKVLGEPGVPKLPEQQPAAPAPAPDPFEATLDEAQREEIEFARYAAQKDPAKYKDLPAKTLTFYKKTADYFQREQNNPERTFDQNDDAYTRFLAQNKPVLAPVERKRLERQQIIDTAKAEVAREQSGVIEEQRQKIHQLEATPKVERAVQNYVAESQEFFAKDEASPIAPIMKKALEAGWNKTLSEDKVFAPIVKRYYDNSVRLAGTYQALINNVQPFKPNTNDDHRWLHEFVTRQAESFKRNGGAALNRDGRAFVAPKEFNEMPDAQRARHWTFNDRDVLERLAFNTKLNIEAELKAEEERLTTSGFVRPKPQAQLARTETAAATPAVAAQPAATPAASPRSTPSTAPGAAQTGPGPTTTPAFPLAFQSALGLAGKR